MFYSKQFVFLTLCTSLWSIPVQTAISLHPYISGTYMRNIHMTLDTQFVSLAPVQCLAPSGQVCLLVTSNLSIRWMSWSALPMWKIACEFSTKFAGLQVLSMSPHIKWAAVHCWLQCWLHFYKNCLSPLVFAENTGKGWCGEWEGNYTLTEPWGRKVHIF